MKRARRSNVWDSFTKKEDEVQCKLCDTVLKYSGSTSNMLLHIKNRHPSYQSKDDSQTALTPFLSGPARKCDQRRAEEITQRVCRMIEQDMMPISMVEGEGFCELINYLEPEYRMPARSTVTARVERHYEELARVLKEELAAVQHVALTTDCWTALTTESYITVTCHYIDNDWEIKSAVLLTEHLSDRHTAENLADKLNSAVQKWGLDERVIACVHDNARNIVSANSPDRVSWQSVPCYAHTLQLAIQDGFNAYVYRVIAAAGKLVKHFNHSTVATEALHQKQQQMQLPQLKVIQSCKTRWNSVCDMFERRMQVDKLFMYFMEMNKNVGLMGRRKMEHISKLISTTLLQVRSEELVSKPALLASVLDPRHKYLQFISPKLREAAKKSLVTVANSVDLDERDSGAHGEPSVGGDGEATPAEQACKPSAMELLLGEDYNTAASIKEREGTTEVESYMGEVSAPLDTNPLEWWKVNAFRFPRLSALARRYLCIPGTSVPSERVFSAAGLTINRLRTRLTPEHANMLIFLNKNMK